MKHFILSLFIILLSFPAYAEGKESAFDRIMRTGVIRCGYYVFPPIMNRDANTGELSGISFEILNRLGKKSDIKIEWAEEVTFGNWVPAMQTKRFDVVCTPMWPDLPQAKAVAFTNSLFYSAKYVVVQENDNRFSSNTKLSDLNNENYTFVVQEGNMTLNTTRNVVPKAKLHILAAGADGADYFQSIISKKADAVIADINAIQQWNKNNPENKLRLLDKNSHVSLQQFPLVVSRGEQDLLNFLNLGIDEMNNTREIDSILRTWEFVPGETYLRVSNPAEK
ncbi:MAG: amino acid ABC transporter substrate-binding protein [Alphaproteobacteria bacterium]|nr:amino acid ABC transporter substrate-binding protein [Alphaproteobacteria bacterium]